MDQRDFIREKVRRDPIALTSFEMLILGISRSIGSEPIICTRSPENPPIQREQRHFHSFHRKMSERFDHLNRVLRSLQYRLHPTKKQGTRLFSQFYLCTELHDLMRSRCSQIIEGDEKLALSERTFFCACCCLTIDRDLNAARKICRVRMSHTKEAR